MQGSNVHFASNWQKENIAPGRKTIAVWGSKNLRQVSQDSSFLRIEDGFLRSVGLGADLVRPLSLVIDDVGIYYDATKPSRLEKILATQELSQAQLHRTRQLRDRIVQMNLSKYNVGKEPWSLPQNGKKIILVVGQVEDDASIRFGSSEVKSNIDLLRRVIAKNPNAYIIYKPHPDIVAGLRKKGKEEDSALLCSDEVVENVRTNDLFQKIDELHTMTSLMGFEALLHGVAVTCHGLPFYAGWGLTNDHIACERRQRKLMLDELVHGALIAYPRYYNMRKNIFMEPEDTLDALGDLVSSGSATHSWYRKILHSVILLWSKIRE